MKHYKTQLSTGKKKCGPIPYIPSKPVKSKYAQDICRINIGICLIGTMKEYISP